MCNNDDKIKTFVFLPVNCYKKVQMIDQIPLGDLLHIKDMYYHTVAIHLVLKKAQDFWENLCTFVSYSKE